MRKVSYDFTSDRDRDNIPSMGFKSTEIHRDEIQKLQLALKSESRLCSLKGTSPSNTLRNGEYKRGSTQLDFSSFKKILAFDREEKWIYVEPKITFRDLCQFTLQHGLIPPVVPEFTSITVGGAIMGAALESSSHRFGQVNDNCLEYELLLGNGELIFASPDKNPDLFYALTGSYGTLALLTAVKLKLIDAKKWVHLTYHRFEEVAGAIQTLTSPQKVDFLEGIVFSRSNAFVITGSMTDEEEGCLYRQNRTWSTWYPQHLLQTTKTEERMLLEEYLFRLDRGAFWMGRYVHSFKTMLRLFFHLGIPKIHPHSLNPNFMFRFLFGWLLSSKSLYRIWHRVPTQALENLFLIHDFYTPFSKALEILNRFMDETEIFPIWLCPIKGTQTPQFLSPHYGSENFLNIGLYGMPPLAPSIPGLTAQLEKEIAAYGGRKMLYSFTYYDQDTFARIYPQAPYNELRKKFSAEKTFPSLYNKVTNSHF